MKLKMIASAVLLATSGFIMPVKAQTPEPAIPAQPASPNQVTGEEVLQACSQDRADTLPNPYSDVSPNDWAYKAVLSMHYCGAYRGAIPLERVRPFLQQQNPQQSRIQSPTTAEVR